MNPSDIPAVNQPVKDAVASVRKLSLWVPLVIVGATIVIADYIVHIAKNLSVSRVNYLTQLFIFVLLGVLLYGLVRRRHGKVTNKRQIQQLLQEQQELDSRRNDFIDHVTRIIAPDIAKLISFIQSMPSDSPATKSVIEGVKRFYAVLQKFTVLTTLESKTRNKNSKPVDADFVNLFDITSAAVQSVQPQIDEKHLQMRLPENSVYMLADEKLIKQLMTSIVDNAVKFNVDGGAITIKLIQDLRTWKVSIIISDTGKGIDEHGLDHLFQPFIGAETNNPEVFNYEGLGFNLYLDKIIVDYLGGSIHALPNHPKGLTIRIDLPINPQSIDISDEDVPANGVPVDSSLSQAGKVYSPQTKG